MTQDGAEHITHCRSAHYIVWPDDDQSPGPVRVLMEAGKWLHSPRIITTVVRKEGALPNQSKSAALAPGRCSVPKGRALDQVAA